MLGLSKSLLMQGHSDKASQIFKSISSGKELASVEIMSPLAETMNKVNAGKISGDDPLSAAYVNALRLVARNNILAAMDGLLDILRQDKRYRNGEARAVMLGVLELLGEENPLTRQYRNELALVLF
jgi:putative thioredoxin